jgi:hypothetical protein
LVASRPTCAARCWISTRSLFRDYMPRENSRVWPEGTLMARRDWKARCWARRCSAAESPEPGCI